MNIEGRIIGGLSMNALELAEVHANIYGISEAGDVRRR